MSHVRKLTDRIILRMITEEEEEFRIILNEQCGFRKEHSTKDQVMRMSAGALTETEKRMATCRVLFDIEIVFFTL